MISKIINKTAVIVISFVLVFIAISLLLTMNKAEKPSDFGIVLNEGWVDCSEQENKPISFPTSYRTQDPMDKEFVFRLQLPSNVGKKYENLYLESYYFDYEFILNGTTFFNEDYRETLCSSTNGARYLCIDLPENWEGGSLELHIRPQILIDTYKLVPPIICNKDDIYQYLYRVSLPSLIGIYIVLLFGAIILTICIIFHKYIIKDSTLLCLGVFAICCGVYLGSQIEWIHINFQNQVALYIDEFASHLLIFIPVLLIFRMATVGMSRRLISLGLVVMMANAIIQMGIFIFTKFELRQMLWLTHIEMIIAIVMGIYILIWGKYTNDRKKREITTSLIPVGICGVIDIIYHYLVPDMVNSRFLLLGCIFFIFTQFVYNARHYKRIFEIEQQNRVYKAMAYRDGLTNLKNRNAYERDSVKLDKILEEGKDIFLCVIMVDVNGLKKVNDTYGHEAGDEMIRTMSKYLLTYFSMKTDIYRMGGDEFLIIISDKEDEHLVSNIEALISKTNKETFYDTLILSFSYGVAIYDKVKHENLAQLVKEADHKMYEMKMRNKKMVDLR